VFKSAPFVRGYTRERPDEHNLQYGSAAAGASREINLSVATRAADGGDLFLRGVANTYDVRRQLRPRPEVGRWISRRRRHVDVRRPADQRDAPVPGRPDRWVPVHAREQHGHDPGSNEASTAAETPRFSTEQGRNSTDVRQHGQRAAWCTFPGTGRADRRMRVGGILNGRGRAFTVTIARPDFVTVNGVR